RRTAGARGHGDVAGYRPVETQLDAAGWGRGCRQANRHNCRRSNHWYCQGTPDLRSHFLPPRSGPGSAGWNAKLLRGGGRGGWGDIGEFPRVEVYVGTQLCDAWGCVYGRARVNADGQGPLVGRRTEQEQLAQFVASIRRGARSLVLLGPAGCGKTALWSYG